MTMKLAFTNSQGVRIPIELRPGLTDRGQYFLEISLPAGSAFTPTGVTPACSMLIASGRGQYRLGDETIQYAPGDDIVLEKGEYFGFTEVVENTEVLVFGF